MNVCFSIEEWQRFSCSLLDENAGHPEPCRPTQSNHTCQTDRRSHHHLKMGSFAVLLSVLLSLTIAESRGIATSVLRFVHPAPYPHHIGWGGCDTCSSLAVANGSAMKIEWTGAHPNRSINLRLFSLQAPSYKPVGRNRLLMSTFVTRAWQRRRGLLLTSSLIVAVPAQTTNVTWIIDVPQPVQDPLLFLLAVDQAGLNCSYSAVFYVKGLNAPAAAKRSDSGRALTSQNNTDGSRTSGVQSQYYCRRFCPSTSSTTLLTSSIWTMRDPHLRPLDPGWSSTANEKINGPSFPATGTETSYNIADDGDITLPEAQEPATQAPPLPPTTSPEAVTATDLKQPQAASTYTTPSPSPPPSEASLPRPKATSKTAQDTGPERQPTSLGASFVSTAHPTWKLTSWSPESSPFPAPRPSRTFTSVPVPSTPSAAISQGDKIRMGIEIPLTVLFVVGVVWLLWRRHRKRSRDGRAPEPPLHQATGRPDPQPLPGRRLSGVHRRLSGVSWLMVAPRNGAWGIGGKDRRGNPLPPQELPADAAEVRRAV